jgi:hypothetical protein
MDFAKMMSSIDVFIRSYYRDFRWLALAIRSMEQFVTGYRQLVVVVPEGSLARLDFVGSCSSKNVVFKSCADFANDYIGQQVTKLHADLYTEADFILHLDSDQIFVTACDLRERLFESGKLKMSVNWSGRRPTNDGWRRCCDSFFGHAFTCDLAAPLPLAVPRHIYAALRDCCEEKHGKSITNYALETTADRFCEMALLRGFAMLREAKKYEWVDTTYDALIPECRTFWSRSSTPSTIARSLPACLSECA